MSQLTSETTADGWNPRWERHVYAQGRHLNHYPYDMVVTFVMRHFGQYADRSAVRLLEVGCGAGNNLWFAAREGFQVAGIDLSASAIESAQTRLAEDGLAGDLQVGSFTTLPWPDQHFDAVIDRTAWTHTTNEHLHTAIAEARRVLVPGGKLLSVVFSDADPDRAFGRHLGSNDYIDFRGGRLAGLGEVHFFTREDITTFFEPQFEVTTLSHVLEKEQLDGERRGAAYWRLTAIRRD